MTTNLIKDTKFRAGGYARTRAWGTRIYKVLEEFMAEELFTRQLYREISKEESEAANFQTITYNTDGTMRYWVRDGEETDSKRVLHVTLSKIGETNKGNFRFTRGKPFTVYAPYKEGGWWSKRATLNWYYPAKATKSGFSFNTNSAHV